MTARNAMLGRLHALKRANGLDDETYRDRLHLVTGHRSASECSERELERAVASFSGKRRAAEHGAKIKALWIALWNLGALDNGSDEALDAFVRRQAGKDRLAFLSPADSASVIEALKGMCARAGFIVPDKDRGGLEARKALIRRQWDILDGLPRLADALVDHGLLERFLTAPGVNKGRIPDLDAMSARYGARIRAARKAAAG